mgnify:CR=1 FL=1
MKQVLFEVPIWKQNIDVSKIKLTSSNFKKSFNSEILTSHDGHIFAKLLANDLKLKKITITHIWRNIYKNSFQERHNHAGSHFSFVIYERLHEPQTIFFHPAIDLMLTTKNNRIFKTDEKLNVVQNDLIIFPGYLDHMVRLTKDGLTISGNFDIEIHDET